MLLSAFPLLLLSSYAVSGAELFTLDTWHYGKFEARLRFAAADGVVSSFFLWKPDSEMSDVYWNEVDIEKIGPCSYSSNVFWGLPESQMPQHFEPEGNICEEWHTHTLEWTPESIVWKLDGEELRRVEGDIAAAFEANAPEGMQIRFNLWVGTEDFGGNFSEASLPVHQFINWVTFSAYTPEGGDNGSGFTLQWREDFDGDQLSSDWATGTWESPLGQSQHAPENVIVRDGVAILALTADDALGYEGTPPEDTEMPDGDSTGDGTTGEDSSDEGQGEGTTSAGTSSAGDTSAGTTSAGDTSGAATGNDNTSAGTTSSTTSAADDDDDDDASSSPSDDDGSEGSTPESSSTSEMDDAGDKGCACHSTEPQRPGLASLLALVGFAASRRRRRA